MEEIVKYLRALVFLEARRLVPEAPAVKPEILLAEAGLSYDEIAKMLNKSEGAVQKAVSRARMASKQPQPQSEDDGNGGPV